MGRSKQSRPIKRRRVMLEADDSVVAEEQTTFAEQQQRQQGGEEELGIAIELLRKTPQHRVEAAAAEATRLDLFRKDHWIHLRLPTILSSTTTAAAATTITTSGTVFDEKENNPIFGTATSNNSSTTSVENTALNTSESSPAFVSHVPSWLGGLGFARLATEDFVAFQKLHQLIKDRVNNNNNKELNKCVSSSPSSKLEWASWSGSVEDPRKRAFGFLPGTWGYDPQIRNNRLDITMPSTHVKENEKNDERRRNNRAMVVLEECEVPEGVREAIQNLCRVFRECLSSKDKDESNTTTINNSDDDDYRHRLAQFMRYEYLIAAQPNLHSGRSLLPVHLDDPQKDGFGVIIVTIGMEGAGTILLRDAKGVKHGVALKLATGEAYMLSDRARDACAHGVLADGRKDDGMPFSNRESLNLRFGLHDVAAPSNTCSDDDVNDATVSDLPIIPASNVFRHWDEQISAKN